MPKIFIVLLSALLWLATIDKSYASCCSSSSSGGVERLLAHERALIKMSLDTKYILGNFNDQAKISLGQYSHLSYLVIEPKLQIMVRLHRYFEPFVTLTTAIQKSKIRTGTGVKDPILGARIPLFKDNTYFSLPTTTLIILSNMPLKKNNKDRNIEDIVSNGDWLINLGALFEKEFNSITYGLSYSLSLDAKIFATSSYKPGLTHALSISMAFSPSHSNSLAFAISPTFHSRDKANGKIVPDSDNRKVAISASFSQTLHSHMKFTSQASIDIPISYLGKNSNAVFLVSTGLRFGVY